MRILGIQPFHDSSVAVINDGKLEAFFKEERFTRVKRDNMPWKSFYKAIQHCGPIDYVAIAPSYDVDVWLPPIKIIVEKMLGCPVVMYYDKHHLTHASLAFYNSGFERALVFVIDRNGSVFQNMRESESVIEASYPFNFKALHKNFWVYNTGTDADNVYLHQLKELEGCDFTSNADSTMSIVKVYESATTLIGQHQMENGKTMGLAAYGKDQSFVNFFANGRPIDNLFVHSLYRDNAASQTLFRKYLGKETTEVTPSNYQFYADYAYQVQKQTQQNALEMIEEWVGKTGITKVCIVGGYGLNVVANEHFVKHMPNVEFYFEPLADDTGCSTGAAMHLYRQLTGDMTIHKMEHTFFNGIKQELVPVGSPCDVDYIVKQILDQKTVAVFNGLAEAGPRALGNRSILFDPRNPNAKDIVNKIKRREWYRPFAGMILEEEFTNWFETHGLTSAEHMTISFQAKRASQVPGVIHADNSCRIQTVSNKIPHIYELLSKFNKQTGCPVLLNTSFNMAGDPLIETQQEAIDTFNNTGIDVLWFPELAMCLTKNKD
jgi:carbamoyltransferase